MSQTSAATELAQFRQVAAFQPRPWERSLPSSRLRWMSPTLVQRDFGRLIRQLGTPAQLPKRRGISLGRRPGVQLPPRPCQVVVVKGLQRATSP